MLYNSYKVSYVSGDTNSLVDDGPNRRQQQCDTDGAGLPLLHQHHSLSHGHLHQHHPLQEILPRALAPLQHHQHLHHHADLHCLDLPLLLHQHTPSYHISCSGGYNPRYLDPHLEEDLRSSC